MSIKTKEHPLYSGRFRIQFGDPLNPNMSMGRLVTFYNNDGNNDPCAHISITWKSQLWFAVYSTISGQWQDYKFPDMFNFYQENDGILDVEFHVYVDRILWRQNSLVNETFFGKDLGSFEFLRFSVNEDFEDSEDNISLVKTNKIEDAVPILKSNNTVSDKPQEVDIQVTGYKALKWLELCLSSILHTYMMSSNNVVIKNLIYCDNNILSSEDRESSKNIVDCFREEVGDQFNVLYIENDDSSYCKNRLTAIKKSLEYVTSSIVTIIDSDLILFSPRWVDTYSHLLQNNVVAYGVISECHKTENIRHAQFMLPRINPTFAHFDSNFLKHELEQDHEVLNDMYLKVNYNGISMGLVGFHFSKLFLNILSNPLAYFHCESIENSYIIPHLYNVSVNDSEFNQRCYNPWDGLYAVHVEGGSFEDVRESVTILQKHNDFLEVIKQYLDKNKRYLGDMVKDNI